MKEEEFTSNKKLKMKEDLEFVKSMLPKSCQVEESKKPGSIHCVSSVGFRKKPYKNSVGNLVTDAEDEDSFNTFFKNIEVYFGNRFQEIFHNTCFCHVDFTIYLRA